MLRRILARSRYLIVIAVIGSFLSSVIVLVYDFITVLGIAFNIVAHPIFDVSEGKRLAVESIEVIDLFLLGTVLYIVALGLYELFIDESLPTPSWLVITSLDDLKTRIIGVIIVLLAVTFLAEVVSGDGSNVLALGVGIGIVLFALGYILNKTSHGSSTSKPDHSLDEQAKE